jgi:ABC-2 type transport system permease protein
MRAAIRSGLIIARRILRQRVRDRSALLFAVVTPLGLALAFSVLIPNDFSTFHTHFVVVDDDHGPFATHLIDDAFGGLAQSGIADTTRVDTEAEALAILRAGDAGAVVIIPAGFSTAIQGGEPTAVRLLGGRYPASFEVARAVLGRFASEANTTQLMIATAAGDAGAAPDPATMERVNAALTAPAPIAVTNDEPPARQAGRATFYAAAMAVMFVFFATQYGALAIHADRQAGTLTRLLAAPIPASGILFGAALASFVLGVVAMSVLWGATTLLVGADWGPPAEVAILIVSAVIAATGLSMVVATLAHTPQQAGALISMIALSMAAVGGVFLPLSQAPAAIVTISQITPHAWFLRGIDVLSDSTAAIADILPSVLVLIGMGVGLGAIGLARARRALVAA